MKNNNTLEIFCARIADRDTFALSEIKSLMLNDDWNIKGEIAYIISEKRNLIKPVPALDDYFHFLLEYYEYCIYNVHNHDDEHLLPAFHAVNDMNQMFLWILYDDNCHGRKEKKPKYYLDRIKELYRKIYLDAASRELETVLSYIEEIGLLHLFMDDKAIEFFSDWEKDRELSDIYEKTVTGGKNEGHRKIHRS